MLKKLAVLATLAVAAPLAAQAEGLSYNYVEGRYVNTDIDDVDVDVDGYDINASGLIAPNFFLFGSYGQQETESINNGKLEYTTGTFGLGWRMPLNNQVDLVAKGGLLYGEIDGKGSASGLDDDDTGFLLNGGVRALLMPNFEVNGGVTYADVLDDDETTLDVGAVFSFTPAFAAVAGASFGSDANAYSAGLRFNF